MAQETLPNIYDDYAVVQQLATTHSPSMVWSALESLWGRYGWFDPDNLTEYALQQDTAYQEAKLAIRTAHSKNMPVFGLVYLDPGKVSPAPYIYNVSARLRTVPHTLAELQPVTALYLNGNRLRILPEAIMALRQLESLNLAGNQLMWLPESFLALEQLTRLNLTYNQFDSLPDYLGLMPNLVDLRVVEGNPLSNLPAEIVAQGDETVLAWLQSLIR